MILRKLMGLARVCMAWVESCWVSIRVPGGHLLLRNLVNELKPAISLKGHFVPIYRVLVQEHRTVRSPGAGAGRRGSNASPVFQPVH